MEKPKSPFKSLLISYLLCLPFIAVVLAAILTAIFFTIIGIQGGPATIVFIALPVLFVMGLIGLAITLPLFIWALRLRTKAKLKYGYISKGQHTQAFMAALILSAAIVAPVWFALTAGDNTTGHDYELSQAIDSHITAIGNSGNIPNSLSEVSSEHYVDWGGLRTEEGITYERTSSGYKICGTFLTDTTGHEKQFNSWDGTVNTLWHTEGYNCFSPKSGK